MMTTKRAPIRYSFCCGLMALAVGASAQPTFAQTRSFAIEAKSLSKALRDYARASGKQIIFTEDLVRGKRAPTLKGSYAADEALDRLLAGSGLRAERTPTGAIMIVRVGGNARVANSTSSLGEEEADLSSAEIVVTAQKREQRLLDTPVPVTAVMPAALVSNNQVRIQDYYTKVPSLSVATDDFGAPNATIRGLTTGTQTNPTVAIVVDELPYGPTSALAYGQQVPDFDPSDLARIEVLRGPQGTLYGANSLGGLIKFVTVDPSTDRVRGSVQAGLSNIHNGQGLGYSARGSVNLPLSDTAAVRASAYYRRDPGYIDNPFLGLSGVNENKIYGGRISLLWRPTESISIKLGAVYQNTSTDGSPSVEIGLGDLQQIGVRGVGGYDRESQVYSALVNADLGGVDLTSITGYSTGKYAGEFGGTDGNHFFSGVALQFFGTPGFQNLLSGTNDKFSQEIRLAGKAGQVIDWRVGGFYAHEVNSPNKQVLTARNPSTGALVGVLADIDYPSTFTEYAGFADITVHISDRFDIQVGGRYSQNKQTYQITFDSIWLGDSTQPLVRSRDNSFTYLLTPEYRINDNVMVYARVASGYRPGGPNINGGQAGLPLEYEADTTQNFDIGIKGETSDRRFTFDIAAYYITWKDIQLYLFSSGAGLSYNDNGSRATSRGVEVALTAHPTASLSLSGWLALGTAKLTQDMPAESDVAASKGDRLPYSTRVSGSLSIEQRIELTSNWSAFVGAAASYVGNRKGPFTAPGVARGTLSDYTRLDFNVRFEGNDWSFNAYVNNLGDERGVLNGGPGTFNPTQYQYIQPRTFGVSATRRF